MIVVSHPTGNQFVRALLKRLSSKDQLESFHTTLNFEGTKIPLSTQFKNNLLRRSYPANPSKVHTTPWREIVRLTAPFIGLGFLTDHETGWASIDAVCKELDQSVAKYLFDNSKRLETSVKGVYCYEDSSLSSFQTARTLGLKCFYDLPIAYWQTSSQLLAEESARYPEWSGTLLGARYVQASSKLDSKAKEAVKSAEIELADVIVVPSKFVYESLPKSIKEKNNCVIAEFGSPDIEISVLPEKNNKCLRVLFVGSMSQRKGLADLFTAFKNLNRSDIELVVMGTLVESIEFYRRQFADFIYEPPRPNNQVLDLMQSCDVLVLPSIVEGRALVQQEAMMCGLPILITPNTGGEDLVEDGRTGFLVPIRSPDKIAEKIAWFADHRAETAEMGKLARERAKKVTWNNYCDKIMNKILSV